MSLENRCDSCFLQPISISRKVFGRARVIAVLSVKWLIASPQLVGNAGKSSALNALTGNKKLARISKTPGRTTEINFFEVEENFKLLDLPGYGFAKSGHSRKKDWGPLLGEYFENREALKAVLIFMDIRHPLKPIDLEMIELCESFAVAYVPVLTKSDKVSKNILIKTIQQVNKATNAQEVLAISSSKETGFEKLRKVLLSLKDG